MTRLVLWMSDLANLCYLILLATTQFIRFSRVVRIIVIMGTWKLPSELHVSKHLHNLNLICTPFILSN